MIWGDWVKVEVDPDTVENDSAGSLVFIEMGVRYLQYHVKREAGHLPHQIKVDLVNPGQTPEELRRQHLQRMSGDETSGPTLKFGALPRPPVVSRTEWGCPDGQGTSRPPVSYTTVTHLIVHHTAGSNSATDWAAVVRAVWNFHFYDRGYIDIGYNYLIDPNGVIYEGRSGGDNVQGAHFSGVNGGTLGVAMLGTYSGVAPTAAAAASLLRILAWKTDQRNLTPYRSALHTASGLMLPVISGHRDGPGATECPGQSLYLRLPRLRAEVQNEVNGASYVAAVSAASFAVEAVAPDSIVAAFGHNLAAGTSTASTLPLPEQLAGSSVRIVDRLNEEFVAPLFHVSPGQVNLLLPSGPAVGPATILVDSGPGGKLAAGSLHIVLAAPGIFTANSDGQGAPAAILLRLTASGVITYEPVSTVDPASGRWLPLTVKFGPPTEQLFLVLFGTGMRRLNTNEKVSVLLGGQSLPVSFLGPAPLFQGVDQVNLSLPRDLAGRGRLSLAIFVDGRSSNQVVVEF